MNHKQRQHEEEEAEGKRGVEDEAGLLSLGVFGWCQWLVMAKGTMKEVPIIAQRDVGDRIYARYLFVCVMFDLQRMQS
jgi:hypothetical protein